MFPNLLFTMSLAGSIVFLLYILTYPLAKKCFSLKWRYTVLKMAEAFYLLPVPLCKYLIINVIHQFFPGLWEKNRHIPGTVDMEYLIIMGRSFVEFSSGVRRVLLAVFFTGIISLFIIQMRIIQYWKWKRVCGADSEKPSDWEQKLFMQVKKETGIKKDVKLVCSEYCRSPMTGGILSFILIFPVWEDKMEADKYEYMFRHELVHIKHHDLIIKYIGLLVMAVHWYNPLVYVLFHEISVISEMYCDSTVIGGKSEEERRKYGDLILTLAMQNEYAGKEKFFAGMADSRNKKVYKRRVLEMKRHPEHKAFLSVIMTVLICTAGVMTVFAYDSPNTVTGPLERGSGGGENYFITESAETEQMKLPSDHFFTDDSGNIYDINDSDMNNRMICVHDYSVHGAQNAHKKDGKGGCMVKSCDAFLCSKCSDVKTGELRKTVTYPLCPHELFRGKSQMKKNYGLTNTELQIMELLWASQEPMSFRDIMNVAAAEWKKSWKVQTLNTFLLGLQKMGLVGADKSMSAYNMYYALCTKEQHIHNWTKKMVAECYDNSFARFVAAFIGDGKLSEEEADELRKLL